MTTPRIRTWAESSSRWWLIVGENTNEVRFGPHKRAGQTKTAEEFLRRLAARDGWEKALEPGSLQAFMDGQPIPPVPDPVPVDVPTSDRPAGRVACDGAAIVAAGFAHQPPPATPWPVGCVT